MNSIEFKQQVKYNSLAKKTKILGNPKEVHLIHDPLTARILAFSLWIPTVNALDETNINSWTRYWQNNPTYKLLPEQASMAQPWMCFWDHDVAKWVIRDKDFTYDEMYYFHLMVEKAAALDSINSRVVHYRKPLMNTINLQDNIYTLKYQEALEISNTPDPIEDEHKWPFIHDYSGLVGLDLRTAANEIIFQHRMYRTRLSNTETLRLKYTRQIKECINITKIESILNAFYADGEIYGKL